MTNTTIGTPGLFFGTRYVCIDDAGVRTIEYLYDDGTSAVDTIQLDLNQAILFAKVGNRQFTISNQAELEAAFPVNEGTLGTQHQATLFELPNIEGEYAIFTGTFESIEDPGNDPLINRGGYGLQNRLTKEVIQIEEGDLVLTAEPCITSDAEGYEVVHSQINEWATVTVNRISILVPKQIGAKWLELFSTEPHTLLKAGAIIRKI